MEIVLYEVTQPANYFPQTTIDPLFHKSLRFLIALIFFIKITDILHFLNPTSSFLEVLKQPKPSLLLSNVQT